MNRTKYAWTVGLVVVGSLLLILTAVLSVSAQAGTSQITRAVLSLYQHNTSTGITVRAHPIMAAWDENVTWNSFAGSYSPTVIGSFITNGANSWRSITITDQVQTWVNNPSQNFGLLLEQGTDSWSVYRSSEGIPLTRPRLDVWYVQGGIPHTITIQEGNGTSIVADTYVWDFLPNTSFGQSTVFETGWFTSTNPPGEIGLKYAMLRFEMSTPTAVALQSLNASAAPASSLGLLVLGTVGLIGLIIWRKRS